MKSQVSFEVLVSMLVSLLIVASLLVSLGGARQLLSETGSAIANSARSAGECVSALSDH